MSRDKILEFFYATHVKLFIEYLIQISYNTSLLEKPNLPRTEHRTQSIDIRFEVCKLNRECRLNLALFSVENRDLSTVAQKLPKLH